MKARTLTCLVLLGCLSVACAGPPAPDLPNPELVILPTPEEKGWTPVVFDSFDDPGVLERLCNTAVPSLQEVADTAVALPNSRPGVAVNLEHPDTADPVAVNEINGIQIGAAHRPSKVWAVPKGIRIGFQPV